MSRFGTVLLVGTLDTKGEEFRYLQNRIKDRGCTAIIMDVGVMGVPSLEATISREQVAEAGGATIPELISKGDRGNALESMAKGAVEVARRLLSEGRVQGVIAMGGSGNAYVASSVMRAMPTGFPKVLVTTVAAGDTRPYVGTKDVTMTYSVVDIAGLNNLSRKILDNAAGAICGMVEDVPDSSGGEDAPMIGATMFGVTTPCVDRARTLLEQSGYDVLVFHATGVGGRTLEDLVESGYLKAVLDVTTTELADEIGGGTLSAGPDRLEAAGKAGIPQVICPGAVDMINFGPMDTVPAQYRDRLLYAHNPYVTLMRTTVEENRILGEMIARKANAAKGLTAVVLPLRGFSGIGLEGQAFHDQEADTALIEAVRLNLNRDRVELMEIDVNINDPIFADAIVETLLQYVNA